MARQFESSPNLDVPPPLLAFFRAIRAAAERLNEIEGHGEGGTV